MFIENNLYVGDSIVLLNDFNLVPDLAFLHPPDIFSTGLNKEEYEKFIEEICLKSINKLKKGGILVSVNTDRKENGTIYLKHNVINNALKDYRLFNYKILIKSYSGNLFIPTFSHIQFFCNGKNININNKVPDFNPDVWYFEKEKIDGYPNKDAYPAKLVSIIIEKFTNEGCLVFDPFIGSGTTALAAKKLNRKYIGFDISSDFIDIANNRLNS